VSDETLEYEYAQLDADYRTTVAQLEEIEARLALQVRENHRNAELMKRLFQDSAAAGLVQRILGQRPGLTEQQDVVDLRAAIEAVLDERDELRRRVERALTGLENAGVYAGTTARILRGTAH
jgi:hypothetical protein